MHVLPLCLIITAWPRPPSTQEVVPQPPNFFFKSSCSVERSIDISVNQYNITTNTQYCACHHLSWCVHVCWTSLSCFGTFVAMAIMCLYTGLLMEQFHFLLSQPKLRFAISLLRRKQVLNLPLLVNFVTFFSLHKNCFCGLRERWEEKERRLDG